MAHAKHTVTVPCPIGEVYDFLADGLNDPKWRPDVIEVHLESRAASASTEVSFTRDLVPKGPMKLLGSVIAKQVESEAAAIQRVPDAMAS